MFKQNYKFKKENYDFWLKRIKKQERKVCTNDVHLDLLEEDQIIDNIKSMLSGGKVDLESSGLSKREWNELMQVLDKKDLIT